MGTLLAEKHPLTTFFHVCFKALALVTYVFANWIGLDFTNMLILCVVFLAFDFWTVKNVSGRLMVGLRW